MSAPGRLWFTTLPTTSPSTTSPTYCWPRGASPIMADDLGEVEEITALCGGLAINIGTLEQRHHPRHVRRRQEGQRVGSPGGAGSRGRGASKLRTETAIRLLQEIRPDAVRGNISEIKSLVFGSGSTKGVDADVADAVTEDNLDGAVAFVKEFARKEGCIAAVTGAIDLVSDGDRCLSSGTAGRKWAASPAQAASSPPCWRRSWLPTPINPWRRLPPPSAPWAWRGEIGWENMGPTDGNSTYRNRLIDAIFRMDGDTLGQRSQV